MKRERMETYVSIRPFLSGVISGVVKVMHIVRILCELGKRIRELSNKVSAEHDAAISAESINVEGCEVHFVHDRGSSVPNQLDCGLESSHDWLCGLVEEGIDTIA